MHASTRAHGNSGVNVYLSEDDDKDEIRCQINEESDVTVNRAKWDFCYLLQNQLIIGLINFIEGCQIKPMSQAAAGRFLLQ